jgi:hypothetical protein
MFPRYTLRQLVLRVWIVLIILCVFLWYYPVTNVSVRVGTITTFLGVCGGLLWLAWPKRVLRWLIGGFYLAVAIFLILPGRRLPEDRQPLRTAYIEAMKSYTGCRYAWGGEGRMGIDCSGLIRRGMEDALMKEGVETLNSTLVRMALDLYWNDTTAAEMKRGYNGRTFPVTQCESLNALDYEPLVPGDLAVTDDGVHVMAYLGNKSWVAADPGEGAVTLFSIPEKKNAYFDRPMTICRWRILSDPAPKP